jgi:uncharacterized protein YggE
MEAYMKQTIKILFGLGIFLLGACSPKIERADGIVATGYATLNIIPDSIILDIGLENRKSSIAESISETKELCLKMINICEKNKIKVDDIICSIIETRIVELEENGKNLEPLTYSSFQSIQIKIHDLNVWEKIIEELLQNIGVDIKNIQFINTDMNIHESAVQVLAIKNATENAEQIAKTMDIKLGSIKYVNFDLYNNEFYDQAPSYLWVSVYRGSDQWVKTIKQKVVVEYNIK